MRILASTLAALFLLFISATPAAAQYVELWSANVAPGALSISPTNFIDLDGDFIPELIVNVNNAGSWHVQVRNSATGAVLFTSTTGNDGFITWTFYSVNMDPSDNAPEVFATDGGTVLVIDYAGAASSPVRDGVGEALMPARPNPFAGSTEMAFTLPTPASAEVEVFDVAGRLVRRLGGQRMEAGEHRLDWDGRDQSGRTLGAGTYFYRLSVDGRPLEARKTVHLGP